MSDEQKNCLYDLLRSGLFEKENTVLKLHYGLGCEHMSFEEICQKYCSTRERIKQIPAKAERKTETSRHKATIRTADGEQVRNSIAFIGNGRGIICRKENSRVL